MNGLEFYGIYRACRDAAWRCQLDFGVVSLPVRLRDIAEKIGVRIVRNSNVNELRRGELGVSIYDGEGWIIIYDDRLSPEEARAVLAHELGHILLGHEYRFGKLSFVKSARPERDADLFAQRVLAPALVLHELGIKSAEDISKLCCVPHELAVQRAKRMQLLETRSSFYKSRLERQLYDNFRPWLEEYRKGM